MANRLAYFFPSAQHRRWLTIFTLMAINGHDNPARIEQRQAGGRPTKGMSDKTAKNYKALAERFYKAGLPQEEFCREFRVSRSKLIRALKFVSKNRPLSD